MRILCIVTNKFIKNVTSLKEKRKKNFIGI